MERIEKLRKRALEFDHCKDEFYYLFYKSYIKNSDMKEYPRYAEAFYCALSELTPFIGEDELLVGEYHCALSENEKGEYRDEYLPALKQRWKDTGGGQESHMAIDYKKLLSKGILGISAEIDGYLKNCAEEKKPFYSACKTCLSAVIRHSARYSETARILANGETDVKRRAELEKIAEICKKVPAYPAESFYEALQSVHFVTYCLSLDPLRFGFVQFQLGRPDRYLYPFYENDVKRGILTEEKAQLLMDCLGIQINMRVPNGLSSGYMLGGRDENGEIVANRLTEMGMQVIEDIRLVYPSVGLCYTREMPEKYLRMACEILSHGRSHPAIFNDDVIQKGLRYYGLPEEEACNYIHSTCVEITPIAASNVWVASPYTNLPQLLLHTLNGEYESFEAHYRALTERLDRHIEANFKAQNEIRMVRTKKSVAPLLSCFVNDCLAQGLDLENGGARYNWIMPSFVGMANLVDSLYAIKEIVYEKKEMTLAGLKAILEQNFEGYEALRLRLLNDLPKYGNDVDEIDGYFKELADHIVSECEKYQCIHKNGRLIPSVFCWVMHEHFGRNTGATPDGRLSGFPLGDGSGACQGREKNGPTASLLSATKWEHSKLIGGVAVNIKFSKNSLGEHFLDIMQGLIKVYMQRGGFELQINVTDREILENAIRSPEAYRDLVVRIGGYSDYFVKLSPQMQQEILLRTEHRI